jgi:DNA-binding transcriptional LysR family regulator
MLPMQGRMTADLRWDDLRLFLVAYRTGSLTRAAQAMDLNQSTTSRRLDALEATLDTRLFERTRLGLVPTEAAHRMRAAAERAEEAAHDALRAIDGGERHAEGEVRLALSDGMATFGIAPFVERLRARHPGLVLSLVVSNALADLTRREADLAVRFVRPTRGDLVGKRVFEGAHALFAASATGPAASALVGWDEDHAHLREAAWEQSSGMPIAVRASTLGVRVALARAGCGALCLPRALGRRLEGLVEVPGVEVPLRAEAWLVAHSAHRDVPRVSVVWDFVERVFAEELTD